VSEFATVGVLASGEQVELASGRLLLTIVTVDGGLRELIGDGWAVRSAPCLNSPPIIDQPPADRTSRT
jgi:hypothetical protein